MVSKKMKAITVATVTGLLIAAPLFNGLRTVKAEQMSSTMTHTKSDVKRVLMVSIDGLHANDLSNFVKANPDSSLASMSQHGITYTNATSSKPSDSFPGLLALVTGGTPKSTGVFYDNSYDRKLLPPVAANAGDQPGTNVLYDESIDKDFNKTDGGGGINPDSLPRDSTTKQPVYPHSFLKVNTVFEAAKAAGLYTAWSDKHLAYDLVNGPSGKGVDDLYTPEIAANGDATKGIATTEANDDLKVAAVLNEIDGKTHDGKVSAPVPNLFGMNFQAVSAAQKLPGNGYIDAIGTFSKGLAEALKHTDQSLGKMRDELKKQNLLDSTLILITAKHGQSPIDPAKLKVTDEKTITAGVPDGQIAQLTTDDIALIWLTDSSKTNEVVVAVQKNKESANIKGIYTSSSPEWLFGNPASDSRTPDIVIQPQDGVIYTKPGKKIAEHGGFSADDTHVGLLASYTGIENARVNSDAVQTMQVAPTMLRALGLDPMSLQAVQVEHTQILPGLDFKTANKNEKENLQGMLDRLKNLPGVDEYYKKAADLFANGKEKGIKIIANGGLIDFANFNNTQPVSLKGRTFISAQTLADTLGARVDLHGTSTITLSLDGKMIEFRADAADAKVNGVTQTLEVPATIVNGGWMVPLRFTSEELGKTVGWFPAGDVQVISIHN